MSSEHNRNIDIWIAGAAAAFTVDLIVYPLDTIKTRLQSADYKKVYRNGTNTAFTPAMFRGVYQGVGSVIIATLPASGAFFSTYESVKAALHRANPQRGDDNEGGLIPTPVLHATASAAAELVSCAILTPAEVIKQNAQMVDTTRAGGRTARGNATVATLRRFRTQPLGLWRGYAALAGRNLPFTALQFPLLERIRAGIQRRRDETGARTHTLLESGVVTAVSAGLGGSVAAVVTTPVDVVKTRLMLSAVEGGAEGEEVGAGTARESVRRAKEALVDAAGKTVEVAAKRGPVEAVKRAVVRPDRPSSWSVARDVVRQDGVRGLFRGGALRGVWTMVGAGLYLGVYDSGRIWLAQRRGDALDADEHA
jgi:hypothetical protein